MPERIPPWLERFRPRDRFDRDAFFSSRIVYYPGSWFDGHAVKLFGSSHSAHCFIYVDYGFSLKRVKEELAHPIYSFRGYDKVAFIQLRMEDLTPSGWLPHFSRPIRPSDMFDRLKPFAFLSVLERDDSLDDSHGPCRLAVFFLRSDGIATYDALFCQRDGTPPPFAILLQDHGFGGNYDRFGKGGFMEDIAIKCNALPQLLFVGEGTSEWMGYHRIDGLTHERGGMHSFQRSLFSDYRGAYHAARLAAKEPDCRNNANCRNAT